MWVTTHSFVPNSTGLEVRTAGFSDSVLSTSFCCVIHIINISCLLSTVKHFLSDNGLG